jgi:hypothetical protein
MNFKLSEELSFELSLEKILSVVGESEQNEKSWLIG